MLKLSKYLKLFFFYLVVNTEYCIFDLSKRKEIMETLKIDNREFKGEFVPFYNNTGFNFKLEGGEMLTGLFKQGYSGQKEFEMPISFNFQKKFMRKFVKPSDLWLKNTLLYMVSLTTNV